MTTNEDEFAFDEEAVVDLDEFEGFTVYESAEDAELHEFSEGEDWDREFEVDLAEAYAKRAESDGEDWD